MYALPTSLTYAPPHFPPPPISPPPPSTSTNSFPSNQYILTYTHSLPSLTCATSSSPPPPPPPPPPPLCPPPLPPPPPPPPPSNPQNPQTLTTTTTTTTNTALLIPTPILSSANTLPPPRSTSSSSSSSSSPAPSSSPPTSPTSSTPSLSSSPTTPSPSPSPSPSLSPSLTSSPSSSSSPSPPPSPTSAAAPDLADAATLPARDSKRPWSLISSCRLRTLSSPNLPKISSIACLGKAAPRLIPITSASDPSSGKWLPLMAAPFCSSVLGVAVPSPSSRDGDRSVGGAIRSLCCYPWSPPPLPLKERKEDKKVKFIIVDGDLPNYEDMELWPMWQLMGEEIIANCF